MVKKIKLPFDEVGAKSFDNFQDVDGLAECFFRWMEHYHPIKVCWNKANPPEHPYDKFREISKRRLEIMIEELNKNK